VIENTGGGSLIVNPNGGKVGIGTKSEPAAQLNVNPNGPGGIAIGNPSVFSQENYTLLYLTISAEKDGYGRIEALKSGGTKYGNLILNQQGGNIGIGTATPAGTLDVQGNVYIGTGQNDSKNYKLAIRGPNQPGGPGSFQDISYEFATAGSAKIRAYRGSSWDTYLQFLTNRFNLGKDEPQVSLHINHDGNVGIGTTTPAQKLVVVGGIRIVDPSNSSNFLDIRFESGNNTIVFYNQHGKGFFLRAAGELRRNNTNGEW
jgi:hypothetical protein